MIEKLIEAIKRAPKRFTKYMWDCNYMVLEEDILELLSELEAINPEKLIKKIQDLDTNLADDYYIDGYYQAIADVVKIIRGNK